MTAPRQQTIAREATLEGIGVHTGESAKLTFRAAGEGQGIRFRRADLTDSNEVPARISNVVTTDRGTAIAAGETKVSTVEHVLAAVHALAIDNVTIELDGPEVPILDGSFLPYYEALRDCGVVSQTAPAEVLRVTAPVTAAGPAGASYAAMPGDGLRISATIEFAHPLIGTQFGSFAVMGDDFGTAIASARTFGFMRDAETLRARGLALGVTLENALILTETGLEAGELRFDDEFLRHKVGDIVGDLALLGRRIDAQIVATRPSHGGNIELGRALLEQEKASETRPIVDIQQIMQHLPHRYPMLLVDRVVEFEPGKRIVGIKNVTINEPFFQGHYPGHPIMPGVLIIEAMAQVGGLLMMDAIENIEEKVVYFMSLDSVKWRRPVTPGDQIRFELEMLQMRRHVCRMKGVGYVDGGVVAEAEMMARIVDR